MARGPAKRELRPGSVVAGKYKLEKQLGRGASGAVWSAINVATSRKVALKLLLEPDGRTSERLLREARAAGAMQHPNVVDVYDVVEADDGSPALVLELLQGQTLQDLIQERAPLPQSEAAAIGRDVARALAIAHASGIIHRDLKPANIFLHQPEDGEPIVKVLDFGISKNLLSEERTLTQTGMTVGSPPFMSPEQVAGEGEIDGRTDLWSLGVILYELLADVRLFEGRPHEVLMQVLHRTIKPIDEAVRGIDPGFARVVNGLLERDLQKRMGSANEVADWLATIAETTAARTHSIPPSARSNTGGDTAALPLPSTRPAPPPATLSLLPKLGQDDEDDSDEDDSDVTHIAPPSLRAALAQRTATPAPADADDGEEYDTRVASTGELSAAIRASRNPKLPEAANAGSRIEYEDASASDNALTTIRPPKTAAPPPREEPRARVSSRPPAVRSTPPAAARSIPPAAARSIPPAAARSIPPAAARSTPPPDPTNKATYQRSKSEKPSPAKVVAPPKKASPPAVRPAALLALVAVIVLVALALFLAAKA